MLTASASASEIGPLPKVADPERRMTCDRSFRRFCETYLAKTFHCRWTPEQSWVVDAVDSFLIMDNTATPIMPRGSGKSSLIQAAALWSALYGHHRYVLLIAANETAAQVAMSSVKHELEANVLLAADFPEVCLPIRALEGIAQRAKTQRCNGVPTSVIWKTHSIRLPATAGSRASGVVIEAIGAASSHWQRHQVDADAEVTHPDLVLVDDPDSRTRDPSRFEAGLQNTWVETRAFAAARERGRCSWLTVRTDPMS